MANAYSHTKGVRWVDKDATTLTRLNVSRIGADYAKEALEGIMDPDNPQNGLTVASTGVSATGAVDRISYVSSAIDAHKIIPFFLDEPAHVSPTFNWRKAIRQTSWYAELGAPPTHGAFVIDASKNAVSWIDLDSATLAVYMTFTGAAANMLRVTGSPESAVDIAVQDFKILIACDNAYALQLIDLLEDRGYLYAVVGAYQFTEDISNRNSGTQSIVLMSSSPAIVNNTVNGVAIIRDPSGGTDHFGRPLHYWAVGTENAGHPYTVYNPINDATYSFGNGTGYYNVDAVMSPSGWFVGSSVTASGALSDYIVVVANIAAMTAGGAVSYNLHSVGSMPISGSATIQCFAILDNASIAAGYPVILGGYNEGLCLIHMDGSNDQQVIFLTSTFVTPLLEKGKGAAYPLDSVTDRSGNAKTLTNAGTVTFTTGIFKNTATFNGSSQTLTYSGSSVNFASPYVSFYMKSTNASAPADLEYIIEAKTSGGDGWGVSFYTSGKTRWEISDDNFATGDIVNDVGPNVYDQRWHHIAVFTDGTNWIIMVDGIVVSKTAISAAAGTFDVNAHTIGANLPSSAYFFEGQVENLTQGDRIFSAEEMRIEYERMQAGLAGFTTLLTATDIDSVQVSPDGEYAIVTAGNVAHIMDPRTGIILSTDAIGAGALNDAAIWQKDGADTPSYLLGASTTVEAVQPDERIGG